MRQQLDSCSSMRLGDDDHSPLQIINMINQSDPRRTPQFDDPSDGPRHTFDCQIDHIDGLQ